MIFDVVVEGSVNVLIINQDLFTSAWIYIENLCVELNAV